MNCLKCGRETAGERVFCEDCLADMRRHPVKPGTVVLLPSRRETHPLKKVSKRRTLTPEEQVRILKTRVKVFAIALLACIAMILLLAYPALEHLREDNYKPGQNYTAITSGTTQTAD